MGSISSILAMTFFVGREIVGDKLIAATFSQNALGFLLFVNVSILIYYLAATVQEGARPWAIIAVGLLIGVSGYVLLHTGSRSSWVASVFFILALVALNFRRLNIRSLVAIAVFMAIAAWYISYDNSVLSRFNTLVTGQFPVRIHLWLFSFETFLLSPSFGYGLNSFAVLGGPYVGMPHNIVMEILLFLGIAGLGAVFDTFFSQSLWQVCKYSIKTDCWVLS